LFHDGPFLRGQPVPELLEQIAGHHLLAGARLIRRHRVAAVVGCGEVRPALDVGPAGVRGQLVAGHRAQQLQQVLRRLQVELSQGGAGEEAGQHRLTDVHRVEDAAQAGVAQLHPHRPPDVRLVLPHQFLGGRRVAAADSTNEVVKEFILGHGGTP